MPKNKGYSHLSREIKKKAPMKLVNGRKVEVRSAEKGFSEKNMSKVHIRSKKIGNGS